ncbi:MAG: hypothetical protein JW751_21015 [Polyangiaceae bacterium]|nr:hypothetical protein [Polyangiaceae bacterium]
MRFVPKRGHLRTFAEAPWWYLLCVPLILSLGWYPLLVGLHLRFVSHQHRYCPEHGRIEDVPSPTNARTVESLAGGEESACWQRNSSQDADPHTACLVSNGDLQVVTCPLRDRTYQSQRTRAPATNRFLYANPETTHSLLLLLAPKHSPPAAAPA